MQHLDEVSLSLETIIGKICEIKHTENNFTSEESFGLKCEEKNSVNLNEINSDLVKDDTEVVLNQGKCHSHNFQDSTFVDEDNERIETTETSSGFEDLSTTKYDETKSSSQEIERKSNETSESKFTKTGENNVKSSEDFVTHENEHSEGKPRMLTSTPKHEERENSFRFNSLDNLNDDSNDSSSTDINEERENGEYLNVTIDEAIEKYEKADAEVEAKFKEVSVQTIIDQLLAVQCRCGLLTSKIGDEEIYVSSSQHPPSKKFKMEENVRNESESSKVTEDKREVFKSQQKISDSRPLLDSLSTKDSTTTIIIENEEGSVCLKKIFPRIRIGLSKRAKPPPLHNKVIC